MVLGEMQLQDPHHEWARLKPEVAVLSSTLEMPNKDNFELSEALRRVQQAKVTTDRELSNVKSVASKEYREGKRLSERLRALELE